MSVQFEVGDIITGKQSATERYSVTIRGAILEVIEVGQVDIRVRVLGCEREVAADSIRLAHEGRNPSRQIEMIEMDVRDKCSYGVDPDYFEFYTVVATEGASELNDFLDEM